MVSNFTFFRNVIVFFILIVSEQLVAQVNGDYRFNYTDSGDPVVDWNWNDANNWQVYASGWTAATNYPGEVSGSGTIYISDGDQILLSGNIPESVGAIAFEDGTTSATCLNLSSYDLLVTGAISFGNPSGDVDFYEQAIVVDGGTLECGSIEMIDTGDNSEDTRIYLPEGTLIVNGDIDQANSNRNGIWFRTFEESSSATGGELYIYGDYNGNGFNRGSSSSVYYAGTEAQVVGNTYYQNIFFTGGTKTFRNSVYVYGTLTLDAVVDINSRQLYLDQGSSLTTSTSFGTSAMFTVSNGGRIYHDANEASDLNSMVYPVGIGSEYTPLLLNSITATGYSNSTYIRFYFYDSKSSFTEGVDNALTRYWNISSNLDVTDVDFTFTYADSDASSPITESSLTDVGYWNGTSWSTWNTTDSEVTLDYGTNQFNFNGNTTLIGDWTLGESSGCFGGITYSGTVSITNGSWNSTTTWNTGIVPLAGEDVTIAHSVYVNYDVSTTANLNSLVILEEGSIDISSRSLSVVNDVNVSGSFRDSNDSGTFTIGGNLNVSDNGNFNVERSVLSVNGNVNVLDGGILRDTHENGNAVFNSDFIVNSGGTVDLDESIINTVGDVSVAGSMYDSDSEASGVFNIDGNLTVESGGSYHLQNGVVNITGITEIYGILYDTDADGLNTFGGKLTVYSGGDFNSDEIGHVFPSEIENNGTFTISSAYNFSSNITFSGSSPIQFTNTADFLIDNNITIVNQNTGGLELTGNVVINEGSTLQLDANSSLKIGDTYSITNNGILKAIGTSGNNANIESLGSGGYTIVQNSSNAEIYASYATFDGSGGIFITDGTVDATENFSNCTFSNGTSNEYLNIGGYDPIGGLTSIQNVTFESGPSYNVSRTSGTDVVTFVQATGDLSGENYDNDNGNPGTLIEWTDPTSIYYSTGDVSAYSTSSWSHNQDGTGGNPTLAQLTDGTLTLIVQDENTVTLDNNGDINVRKLIVGEGNSGSFIIGGDATQQILTIQELLQVEEGGTIQSGSAGAPAHILRLYGNVVNNGNFDLRQSFTSVVNTEVYGNMVFSGTVSPTFSQLTLKSGCNATADVALDVDWDLILETGAVLNDGGNTHTIEFNWTNNGGTYNATGEIIFDGGTSSITASGTTTTFNDVTFSGSGIVTIKEDVIIDGNTTITDNTKVSVDNVTVTVNGDYTVDEGSEYVQTSNYIRFEGTDAQLVTLNGGETFNRVYFSNGGSNVKTVVGDLNVGEWLMIDSGATVEGSGNQTIQSGLRIDGTCNFSGIITMNGGYIDTNDASVNDIVLGTAQLVIQGGVNLRHNVSGETVTITAQNDINVVDNGSLVINDDAILVGQNTNTLKLEAGRNLYIRGADNFPNNFIYDFDPTANVVYDASIDQTVRGGFTYGRIYLRYANRKTVDGPLTITGHLYLRDEAILDLGTFSHVFSGSYIYNGTDHNGSIEGENSTFTIGGTDSNQGIEANGTGTYTFGNLILTQNGATATRTQTINNDCNIIVTGDLTINNVGGTEAIQHIVNLNSNPIGGPAGNLDLGAYCQLYVDHLNFGDDVIDNFTSTSFDVNSTVYYSLNGGSPTDTGNPIDVAKNQYVADGVTYGSVLFANGNKIAEGNLDINGDLKRSGTCVFYDGGYEHTLAGNWQLTNSVYYTETSATGTIIFDGVDQDVNGVNFNNITISNSGTANLFNSLNIFGDLVVEDGSNFEASTLNMNIGGDITVNGTGEYTQTTGYTYLVGDEDQNLVLSENSCFGYLTINKSNSLAQTVSSLSDIKILHDLNITANSGILDITNQQLNVGDDMYIRNCRVDDIPTQNFITTGSNIVLDGTTAQYIYLYHENDVVFNNITFEGSGDKTILYGDPGSGLTASENIQIQGDVVIDATVLDGYTVNLYVQGDWNNSGTFNHSRTVYFDGADQSVSSSNFNHVNFQGSGTKTLDGNITVSYDLNIEGTATLDANGNDITLGRTWYNEIVGARYIHGNGKVVFNGATGGYIYSGTTTGSSSGKDFYSVDINKSDNFISLRGDLFVETDFDVSSNTFYTNEYDVYVGGDFNVGGTFSNNNNNGTLTLNASGGTHVFNPNGAVLRGIQINAPVATYEMQSDFTLDNVDMNMVAGTLNVNENQIQINDYNRSIEINGGVLNLEGGSTVLFTNQQTINLNSGELHIVGEDGKTAKLSNSHVDNHFSINALGGDFSANYYRVQNGQIVIAGATIDATNNLSNGTFVEGDGGTSYITLTDVDLGTGISLSNMIFNSGADYNITRTSGNGVVTVLDASGGMAGEAFEEDDGTPGTLIEWTFPAGFFWDGGYASDNTNWHQAENWSGNTVPGINDIVYFDHTYVSGAYNVLISDDNADCSRLNITDASGANSINVTIGSGNTLNVDQHVVIGDNTILTQEDNSALLYVGENWTNQGTYNHNNSKVIFNATSGNYIISTGGISDGNKFYDIEINAGTSVYTLDLPMVVENDLTINAGTLDLASSSNDVNIGGDWYIDQENGGSFVSNTADVTFDGTLQSITNGVFYNLIIEGSSATTLNSNIAVEGELILNDGSTLDAQDRNIYVRGNWQNNNGTFSQTGLGTVLFDGSENQYIDNGTTGTTFNILTFSNGSSRSKYLQNNINVNGNVLVNEGSGVLNVGTYLINGVGTDNSFTCNNVLQIEGENNFPTGFETIDLSDGSLVRYYADIDQYIYPTSYGRLSLRRLTDGVDLPVKTALGDLTISNELYLNSSARPVELDMETNDADIILSGNINFVTNNIITWGTGNSTLDHVGTTWYIDPDISSFNNVVLEGSGNKFTQGNLSITGDLTVKSGVDLRMYVSNSDRNDFRTITGTNDHTITLETGARIINTRPSTDGVAIPEGFGTYDFNENSSYYLYSNAVDQTVYTGSDIAYGNLIFSSTKNVTGDGVANLDVNGNWDLNESTYYDGGTDMEVAGSDIIFNRYVASSTDRKLILNGSRDQSLREDDSSISQLDLPSVECTGTGIKTISSHATISGDLYIDSDVTLLTSYNIYFTGSSWQNDGFYQQTGNSLFFNGTSDQTIDPGVLDPDNYYQTVEFNGASTKTFVNNGIDINNDLVINEGTVDLATYNYYLYDELYNISGGTLVSENANLYLDGTYQNIETPDFAIKNITCSGGGTKYLYSDWTINNDLLIESGVALNTRSNSIDYDIYIGGDWTNEGTFVDNTGKVTFNGYLSPVRITSGGSNFYDVDFTPTTAVTYTLESESTTFHNQMNIESNANVNLNSKELYLGRNNTSAVTHTINGSLTIDENAFLYVNNDNEQTTLDVYGTLNIVGASASEVATLTSETTASYRNKTIVNINPGATFSARYYLIEYIADEGLNLMEGSTLDAVNNFSDGTFMGLRDQQDARYIVLESDYSGGNISNVSFSYDQVPEQGKHYNVERKLASTDITFENVSGAVGSYRFEDDDQTPAHDNGKLRWPEITETNWTGAISTDWHNDGNWDNGVPTATIDAIIGQQDNIAILFSGSAECKSLKITDGTLRIEDNMDITVNGDVLVDEGVLFVNSSGSEITVGGDWTVNQYGNYLHGNGSILFNSPNGSVNILPGGSSFYNITFNNALTTFNIIGSDVDVDGDLTIYNGVVSASTNNYTYNLYGNYLITNGEFDTTGATNGTIILSSDNDQTVTNGIFYNLIVDGSGNKLFEGNIEIDGSTQVNSVLSAQTGCNITFNGDVTVDAAATFEDGDENHQFKGRNWYGDGTYSGNGTITFNRTSNDQNIYLSTFNNLVIDCSSITLYLREDVSINGDLTFKNGISNVNLLTNTFTSDGTGTFTVEDGVITYIYGANNFPKAFSTYDIAETSDTRYYGSSDQNIDGVSYGILRFDNANTKTLTGDAEVKGNLIFNETIFDVSNYNYTLTIGGNWHNTSSGDFICREGDVIFNGADNQTIYFYDANENDFYNLIIEGDGRVSASNSTNNDFVIANNLNVTSGEFNANGRTIYVGGDLLATSSGTFTSSGLYYLNKASGTASIGVNSSTLNSLSINSGATYTVQDDISMTGSFILSSGVFNGNGNQIDIGNGSSDIVTINGTYIVGAGGVLGLGYGTSCTVGTSGRIEVVGSTSGLAKVTNNSSGGRYSLVINGEIAAEYYLFEYMSNVGIYLTSTSVIDATNHFSNGTFSNGATTGQLFRVENTQSFTEVGGNRIENVSFPINPGGSASNVGKYSATSGDLEFYNSTGVFAGESFDNDSHNLIDWTGPVQLTWNGSVDTDWNKVGNWTASSGSPIVPTTANNVTIPSGLVNYPELTIDGQETGNLLIETGAEVRIHTSSGDTDYDLNVDGDLTIEGSLGTSSSEDIISVEGNWTATSGSVVILKGNVTFDGVGGAKQIDNRTNTFYSLTISGSTQYQIARNTKIVNDLTINSGASLDANPADYQITVNGNWINNGSFNPHEGTVLFSATSGSKTIDAGNSSFYDVQINASGITYLLNENMEVDEQLLITSGELDLGTSTLVIGDGSGTDGISISGSLLINAGATLDMNDGASLNLNSGGSMELLGDDESNRATLTSSTGGRYSFDVNSGASIKAQYYSVDYTDADGLYMHPGANIDEVNNLSDGVFSNGASGGSYMTIHHDMSTENFTLRNLVFNEGPSHSVTRTSGWTIFMFEDASGELGNYLYERDEEATPSPSSGLLRWPYVNLYTWEGDNDTDWNNEENWFDNQLPLISSDVTIPVTDNNPVIDASQLTEIHGMTIETGAEVTIQSGAKLTMYGDLTIDGAMTVNTSVSTPTSIIIDGSVTGEATYNWSGLTNMYWWHIGHPVTGVTDIEYDASYGGTNYALNRFTTSGWQRVAGISGLDSYDFDSDLLEGYSLLPRYADQTLSYSGTINTDASYSQTYSKAEWYLVANPYSSYIDVENSGFDIGDFRKTVYIESYNNVVSTYNLETGLGVNGGSSYIAPGQAMWLRTYEASDAIAIGESTRVHSTGSLKSSGVDDDGVFRLKIEGENNSDETIILISDIMGSELLTQYDSEKMNNGGDMVNVYSFKENKNMTINTLPELESERVVPIGYSVSTDGMGDFTFKASNITSFMTDVDVYLIDKLEDVTVNLREIPSYTFTPSTAESGDRFELLFKASITTDITNEEAVSSRNVSIYSVKQLATVKVSNDVLQEKDRRIVVYDISGGIVKQVELNDEETTFTLPQPNAVYIINVKVDESSYQQKVITQN